MFTSDEKLIGGMLAAFALVALLASVDLVTDLREGTTAGHVLVEGGVFVVGLAGAVFLGRRLRTIVQNARAARDEAAALGEQLEATTAEAARWRQETRDLLKGLSASIDTQFERWALSPAEKEVALLLLKGLSHKEIAAARSITEATARQQGRAVYKKAGLSGRSDLAAFFLEDLLLPMPAAERDAGDAIPKS
ncbi:MAG: helix-turn-helix transcriptional regulator [Myxococcota bacterium]